MGTLAQVPTEEYFEHGVHVANVVIDIVIDDVSPKTSGGVIRGGVPSPNVEATSRIRPVSCWDDGTELRAMMRASEICNQAAEPPWDTQVRVSQGRIVVSWQAER